MTKLRQFGGTRGNFDQGAARTCNGALQMVYQHPWSPKTHTCAVAFLPTLVGELFGADRLAQRDNLMHHAPMHALAMRSELAFFGGFPPPGGLVALALFPVEPPRVGVRWQCWMDPDPDRRCRCPPCARVCGRARLPAPVARSSDRPGNRPLAPWGWRPGDGGAGRT